MKRNRKLTIAAQTIRRLTGLELASVNAGATPRPTEPYSFCGGCVPITYQSCKDGFTCDQL